MLSKYTNKFQLVKRYWTGFRSQKLMIQKRRVQSKIRLLVSAVSSCSTASAKINQSTIANDRTRVEMLQLGPSRKYALVTNLQFVMKGGNTLCKVQLRYHKVSLSRVEPHSSVGSVEDLRTGGRWYDPRLGQYSFRGLIIVIATGFIPLSPLSVVSTMVMWESSQWLGRNIVRSAG